MEVLIPDKLFFKIGEVAQITSLRPSVLRYWESEFETLKPNKSRSGQRLYTKKELELVIEIKKLLYGEKLTIEGARKKLTGRGRWGESKKSETDFVSDKTVKVINEVIEELREIRKFL